MYVCDLEGYYLDAPLKGGELPLYTLVSFECTWSIVNRLVSSNAYRQATIVQAVQHEEKVPRGIPHLIGSELKATFKAPRRL